MLFRLMLGAALCLGAMTLNGCATLSEGQCRTVDWYELGNQDGGNGMARTRLNRHQKACAEYGIRPRSDAYYSGRKAGLKRYCTARNGFREGRAGHAYRGVCPGHLENDFLDGYRMGEAIHSVDTEMDRVKSAMARKKHRLQQDDISRRQRLLLRQELHSLDQELYYLQREITRLHRRSVHAL